MYLHIAIWTRWTACLRLVANLDELKAGSEGAAVVSLTYEPGWTFAELKSFVEKSCAKVQSVLLNVNAACGKDGFPFGRISMIFLCKSVKALVSLLISVQIIAKQKPLVEGHQIGVFFEKADWVW